VSPLRNALAAHLGQVLTPEVAAGIELASVGTFDQDIPPTSLVKGENLDFDMGAVWPFMRERMGGLDYKGSMRCIGHRRNGELLACVIYEDLNPYNVWIHAAAKPGTYWCTPRFLRASFDYPFKVCGVARVSAYVDASNTTSRSLLQRLGFAQEARLASAAQDGGDAILYVKWKQELRHGQ
jgi:hypothetical protein